jgi:hypothetical protein
MRISLSFVVLALLLPFAACFADSETATVAQKGGREKAVAANVVYEEWIDQKRNRTVPVKIYFPEPDGKSHPVVIF